MEDDNEVVVVRNARRSNGRKKVLRSLDMTVKKNAIYGLLGPSSCGKTTLLGCILGLKKLDSGQIDVKLRRSNEVGYMPQEVALFENFKPTELCHFYAKFFGLNEAYTKERIKSLMDFLGLEECKNRLLSECSGGQKRRVSFLIALLHDPKLLILDEPTVGMDCILSDRIWKFMMKLSNDGKTIIITTHYIQEANHCSMIGLMRNGRLLEEKPPNELMGLHNSSNLEDIFLTVCKKQDQQIEEESTTEEQTSNGSYKLFPGNTLFDENRFKALLEKNLLLARRNRGSAAWLFVLPIVISVIYYFVLGQNPIGLKLGLYSLELINGKGWQACEQMGKRYVEELNCTLPEVFTCAYVDALKKHDIVVVPYDDFQAVAHDIEKNKVWGSIEIPDNFTTSLISRVDNFLKTPNSQVASSYITSRIDGANSIIKLTLVTNLRKTMEQFFNSLLTSCGMSEKNQIVPIKVNDPIYGINEIAYGQSALPGFICSFGFYFTIMFTTSSLMVEKVQGVTERLTAAGMTYTEIVLSHIVLQFVVMFLQNIIMFFAFYGILSYTYNGSIYMALILAITINCVGISFGFFLSELFTKEVSTSFAAVGATVSILTTVGVIWPQEGMHYLLQLFKPVIPVSSSVKGMQSLLLRNFNFLHPFVASGLLANLGWTVIFTAGAFALNKFKK